MLKLKVCIKISLIKLYHVLAAVACFKLWPLWHFDAKSVPYEMLNAHPISKYYFDMNPTSQRYVGIYSA